jgi:hypothetical protein
MENTEVIFIPSQTNPKLHFSKITKRKYTGFSDQILLGVLC